MFSISGLKESKISFDEQKKKNDEIQRILL